MGVPILLTVALAPLRAHPFSRYCERGKHWAARLDMGNVRLHVHRATVVTLQCPLFATVLIM